MANKFRGEVQIRLDRVRVLKFDSNACADFEEAEGTSLFEYAFRIATKSRELSQDEKARLLSFKELRALVWAGLRHEDESLTLRGAGALMDQADGDSTGEKLLTIWVAVSEALGSLWGEEAKKKARAELEEANLNSGPSPSSSDSPSESSDLAPTTHGD